MCLIKAKEKLDGYKYKSKHLRVKMVGKETKSQNKNRAGRPIADTCRKIN